MSQLLANLQDIGKHLPNHKVTADDSNTAEWQVEANRIVKSKLSGVFSPTTLHSWNTPDNTPGLIRTIAGMLIAAYLYRTLYAEDVADVSAYAQDLYNSAIAMLDAIVDGSLVVVDDNDVPIPVDAAGIMPSVNDFYPNAGAPGPFFKMSDTWA